MRLNYNQKVVLLLNFMEFAKSVLPAEAKLPPELEKRAIVVAKWLHDNVHPESQESKAGLQILGEHNLPPAEPNVEYGSIQVGALELLEGITQVLEAVIDAELSPDRIPDPTLPRRVRNKRVETFQPRRGARK